MKDKYIRIKLEFFLILKGVISILASLVNDGILSIDEAAVRANMSAKDFEKFIK